MSYTVAQNASFLTFASILQKAVSFIYFTVVARVIGVGNTGSYFFAIAFTTIFSVIADFGFAPVLTREVSKFPTQAEKYLNTVLVTKIIFGVSTYFILVVYAWFLHYSMLTEQMIFLSGVTMVMDNLQTCFFSVFRAKKNLIYESIAIVISQVLTLVIGSIALFLKLNLIWLIVAYTIPSTLMVFYGAYFVHKKLGVNYRLNFDKQIFRTFLKMALPFAAAGILGRLYSYSDSLIMSKMLTEQHLGWWSVPYKIAFAFQFIPVALSASVYPAMSSLYVTEPGKVGDLFSKAWKYLFTIVFPLSFGLIAVAHPVIAFLYGPSYLPSVLVLQILMIALIFSYLSLISGAFLNATNRQSYQTGIVAISLIVNIGFNLFLIPKYDIVGAAVAALISNFTMWVIGLYFVNRNTVIQKITLIKRGSSLALISFFMAIFIYALTIKISFIITVPIGIFTYVFCLFAFGIMKRADLQLIMQKIRLKKPV